MVGTLHLLTGFYFDGNPGGIFTEEEAKDQANKRVNRTDEFKKTAKQKNLSSEE